jgi:Fe-S cluster assembly protein SufD
VTALSALLPTRRDEAWRYADLKAVATHWPPPPARLISVPAGGADAQVLRIEAGGIHDVRIELAAAARLQLVVVIRAPDYARVSIEAHLKAGADLDLGGVLLGGGDTSVELVTDIRHLEPDAVSRQRVRLVLDDRATGSYLGRIAVARDAQRTDAAQSAKALVLKRTATANLKPELEIFADDVKCGHGCTVGELDRTAIFYLESRGIPRAEAEALLARAFVADALEGVADEALREALDAETRGWLERRI